MLLGLKKKRRRKRGLSEEGEEEERRDKEGERDIVKEEKVELV